MKKFHIGPLVLFMLLVSVPEAFSETSLKKIPHEVLRKEHLKYEKESTEYKKAIDEEIASYKKACKKNKGEGCRNLGSEYTIGMYVVQDYSKAIKYFRKACDLNDGIGCNILGSMYFNGQGVKKDFSKAYKYQRKACDLNTGIGCTNIGFLYFRGLGVTQDYSKAMKYLRKACNLKEQNGCTIYKDLKSKGY